MRETEMRSGPADDGSTPDDERPIIGHIGPDPDENVYDAITELYLGLERAGGHLDQLMDPDDETEPGLSIDVLLLGHLPISGAAWASQHARAETTAYNQPCVLVRLSERTLCLDASLPENAPRPAAAATIADAIKAASELKARFVLVAGSEREAADAIRAGADSITLLGSDDEASRVATYRMLKGLSAELGDLDAPIRAVLLASDAERGARGADALDDACERFLGFRLLTEVRPNTISPGPGAASLYIGRFEGALTDLVGSLQSTTEVVSDDAATPTRIEAPTESPPAPETPAPRPVIIEPTPAEAVEAPTEQTSLAANVYGLTPIAARCPFEKDVELAIDAEGRLHVLADGADEPTDGVARLEVVQSWASEHAELIGLTLGPDAEVLTDGAHPHLFVREPKRARRLLDGRLSVHLLREVACPQGTTWISIELN